MTRPPVAPSASAAYMPGAGGEQLYTLIEGDPEPRGVVWYVLGPELASTPLYPGFTRALHQAGLAKRALAGVILVNPAYKYALPQSQISHTATPE